MKTNFEERIREAANNHKVDYNPQHWTELEQKLNQLSPASPKGNFLLKGAAVFAAILAGSAVIYFSNNQGEAPSPSIHVNETGIKTNLPQLNDKAAEMQAPANEITVTNDKKLNDVKTATKIAVKANEEVKHNTSSTRASEATSDPNNNEANSQSEEMVTAEVLISATEICEGETVSFEIKNVTEDYNYSWKMNEKIVSGSAFKTEMLAPGTYPVVLTSISSKNQRSQKTYQVKVIEKPIAGFHWKEEQITDASPAIAFSDASEGAREWSWNFGDNEFSGDQSPLHNYATAGNYLVELTVKNSKGCTSTASQMIAIKDNNPLLAPNAFSPDGDGINETFIPRKLEIIDIPFELTIFDRSGNVIYKTTDKAKPWNGSLNNSGEQLQPGSAYIWTVTTKDEKGKENQYKGVVGIVK